MGPTELFQLTFTFIYSTFNNKFSILFMGFIALFDTIHESHYTISANFYLYLRTFNKKFSVSTK